MSRYVPLRQPVADIQLDQERRILEVCNVRAAKALSVLDETGFALQHVNRVNDVNHHYAVPEGHGRVSIVLEGWMGTRTSYSREY